MQPHLVSFYFYDSLLYYIFLSVWEIFISTFNSLYNVYALSSNSKFNVALFWKSTIFGHHVLHYYIFIEIFLFSKCKIIVLGRYILSTQKSCIFHTNANQNFNIFEKKNFRTIIHIHIYVNIVHIVKLSDSYLEKNFASLCVWKKVLGSI